jgi:hypothetical protein
VIAKTKTDWKILSHFVIGNYVLKSDLLINCCYLGFEKSLKILEEKVLWKSQWSKFSFKCPIPKQKYFLSLWGELVVIWVWPNETELIKLTYFWFSYFMGNWIHLNFCGNLNPNLVPLIHIKIFLLHAIIFLTLVLLYCPNHIKCLHTIFLSK